jgi:hypothetical protein
MVFILLNTWLMVLILPEKYVELMKTLWGHYVVSWLTWRVFDNKKRPQLTPLRAFVNHSRPVDLAYILQGNIPAPETRLHPEPCRASFTPKTIAQVSAHSI